jgi:hypothetical protein
MQLSSSKDSYPFFTRLNPCVAHYSTDSIPWVHHSREEGSLDYDGGFVRLQIHMNFDTIIYRQHSTTLQAGEKRGGRERGSCRGGRGRGVEQREGGSGHAQWMEGAHTSCPTALEGEGHDHRAPPPTAASAQPPAWH